MMNMNAEQLIGKSAEFMRVVHAARMVAVTDTTVLLVGEKGTGKTALAGEIHRISRRRVKPFRLVSCSADAEKQLAGLMSTAADDLEGGTLYLDDVANLSLEGQRQLMAFFDAQESDSRLADVRVIASSSVDLYRQVELNAFREDLYYRLYIVPLEVPALRDRTEDIPMFVKHFTGELARKHGRRAPSYSVSVKNLLKRYHWPGNLRELRNFCERMVIMLAGQGIQPEHLPAEICRTGAQSKGIGFVLPREGINLTDLESDVIRQALELTGGNRSRAARLLGISRDTLLYRIQKHAISA
ncbi:MAG: sigma 54-interacting transcriptional regulator [Chromatiales bacterium]|nr:sigma 54-interacting transcriptional regulator [Chromatiales bacterium]